MEWREDGTLIDGELSQDKTPSVWSYKARKINEVAMEIEYGAIFF